MNKKESYAKELTKEYLVKLGITEVTEDSHIFKDGIEVTQHTLYNKYKCIILYDKCIRQSLPKEERKKTSGSITLPVQRVVFAWFNNVVPKDFVVDHKDNNKFNNHKDNLQLLKPGDNIWKDRVRGGEIKCQLNKPRSFYEEKLRKAETLYKMSKEECLVEEAHQLRNAIARYKRQLMYYDNHKGEN